MKPTEIQAAYAAGQLEKARFIEQMFAAHRILFDYADLLQASGVGALEINHGKVVLRLNYPPIRLELPRADQRAAPVEAINFGAYEAHEFAALQRILSHSDKAAPLVVDVGGNVGFYSIGLKAVFPALRVHAFEPVPRTAEQFVANCALNGIDDIVLHRCGLSDRAQRVSLFVHPNLSVAASQANILESPDVVEIPCEMAVLDALRSIWDAPVDLIKCDVEGAELMVFRGAVETLDRDRPMVFTEMLRKWSARFGYHPNDLIELMGRYGYRCLGLADGRVTALEAVDERTRATNFLFLHPQQHARQLADLAASPSLQA